MTRRLPRPARFLLAALAAAALPAVLDGQARKAAEIRYPELPPFAIPHSTRHALTNGMVLLLLEDHELPLVEAVALVRTGSRLEPAGKAGLAGLTGAVLRTGGTAAMAPDALDDFLENRAAAIESAIDLWRGEVRLSCLAQDFPELLRVLADVLRRPAFAPDRLAIAKQDVEAAIARQNDDPQEVLRREFRKVVYGADSPYARGATYATLGGISRDDLAAWHRTYYHPNRIVLGLVGDFRTAEAVSLLQEVFGDWPPGAESADAAATYRREPNPGVFFAAKDDVTQSFIRMGHLGVRKDHPDFYALEVLNDVFSGGLGSRLFSNVRSRQALAYAVFGSVGSQWDHEGLAAVSVYTKTETTGAAIEALQEEVRNLTAQPPTAAEVEDAKATILNAFVFSADSTAKVLEQELTFANCGYPADWLERYRAGIERVTLDEVRGAARHLRPDEFAIVVVGKSQGMDKPLATYGRLTPIDLSIPEPPALPE